MRTLRYFIVVALFLFFQKSLTAQNVSPQFSELKGMEDAQGNTHLFYRIYSYENLLPYGFHENNSVYHLDLNNNIDTLFIHVYASHFYGYHTVNDYNIITFNPTKYLAANTFCYTECNPSAYMSDSGFIFSPDGWGSSYKIESGNNDSIIYYGLDASGFGPHICSVRSFDGGQNWDTLSALQIFISLNPYNNNESYYIDSYNQHLYKSSDGGNTFYLVDTTESFLHPKTPDFYYDFDQMHIYKKSRYYSSTLQYYLSISENNGEPFSWQVKYSSNDPIFVSIDTSQSGAIYLADGKNIFYSSDYGNVFTLYKELDKKIIGIYKKPNSDKLYAATKYQLYEITNPSISVIKTLPTPVEIFEFYPLKVGNRWVYERTDYSIDWITGSTIIDTSFFDRRVTGIQTKPNGKQYYQIADYDFYFKQSKVSFERIDSVTGLIYRYDESLDTINYEFVIDDLMAELGEEIISGRLNSYYSPVQMLFNSEDYFADLGLYGKRNGYWGGYWGSDYYSLVSGVGLDSVFVSVIDAFDAHIDLVGCVLNGIVYGDTTLTDIQDDVSSIPTEFKLEQNYPNPFNPGTKISWQSPVGGYQSLRVYDVLGNEVATLVDEYRPAGSYDVEFGTKNLLAGHVGSELSSGIYFYQLKAGDYVETKKMLLLK